MKIARIESLHADAGQRNFDFLKITTDEGLAGWSEYNESFGGLGVSAVIDGLAPLSSSARTRAHRGDRHLLYAVRRQASGGVVQQAIGAIENALPRHQGPGARRSRVRAARRAGARADPALLVALRDLPAGRGRRRCRSRRCARCRTW